MHVTHIGTYRFAARYTSDTGGYRLIIRRFDYGLPPRVSWLSDWKVSTHARTRLYEPPWCTFGHRIHVRIGTASPVCVFLPLVWFYIGGDWVACNAAENKGWVAPSRHYAKSIHGILASASQGGDLVTRLVMGDQADIHLDRRRMIHSDVLRDREDFRHLLTFSHPVHRRETRGTIVFRLSIARIVRRPWGYFDCLRV